MEVILLDKVQKNQPITDDGIKLLKSKGLVEGRKPNFYISAKLAEITGKKTLYTKNKGFDKDYYQDLILKHIQNHNYATRFEIDELLFNILPDHKNEKQRKIFISNIIREMAGSLIENIGSRTKPKWVLLKN